MDASIVFRQVEGFGDRVPRSHHEFSPPKTANGDEHGENENPHRIAHTLTACCRCRQRKTRCDPTLPRCLPCERSGSICEYFDTTKGKKISRYYVVKLQERVRALDAELAQYIDEDESPHKDQEDVLRPGGLVRLNETDETPRYLGPSSGIAMTRIVMAEAKRYTNSGRISELVPNVEGRRKAASSMNAAAGNRSQSFSMPVPDPRKKSYPMVSAVPAAGLPSRGIADKLIEVFHQRAQVFNPALHERVLANAVEDVYAGTQDPYQNFIVRLVMAISMQKLDSNYAGLADSYYLAAMQFYEAVVRPKDLKTLQCLVLIGQYSLLTPTRTAVYYVVGLATRISQQLGLADEKTIALGASDPLSLDMRRRLSWIVSNLELGLSQSMGRPNGFAKTDDLIDIKWFETVPDANISENGITPGPPDEKKLVAIHFCKMRMLQAEIRRTLYEIKRPEPRNAHHPWFASMEAKMDQWLRTSPEKPPWCKPWFTGRFHTMVVTLHRPSPQVPKPSSESASKCYDSAAFVINISSKQMMSAAVDITWVFLLTLYMSLNTLLWCVASYSDIRAAHSREEVQELVNVALDIIDQCVERWPGTASASELYSILTKACLQSYDSNDTPRLSSPGSFNTPPSQQDTSSPNSMDLSGGMAAPKPGAPAFNPPQFGYVFGAAPESLDNYSFDASLSQHPTFRSNSIFMNPASNDHTGRRFSYFPPDFTQGEALPNIDPSPPPSESTAISPPFLSPPQLAQTPPESMSSMQAATPVMSTINTPMVSTPLLATSVSQGSPEVTIANSLPQTQPRAPPPAFTIPSLPPGQLPHGQRPLPQATTVTDWFNPPPPFISPYSFGSMGAGYWGNSSGMNGFVGTEGNNFDSSRLPPERQGSLSHAQQIELMGVLENEGMADIDSYLNTTNVAYGNNGIGNANMELGWATQS
ncbi:hypothetical protein F5B22DRAFT_650711 [Xylaria bambusicola]|uniref:uncharacterized protein n=1 Tax=Xylaria bambusicola TaxID=326684 RepID=UPI0020086C31|nr:uncharacterized protein F5B22DRAFT_650711 [Xylaria bambusicola]KAI0506460.1 hypothetical protein F5B22DRAFT_650711 [Xylaria bambusicola]